MKKKYLIAFSIWLAIQCSALLGTLFSTSISQHDAIAGVLQRISLDTLKLDLGNDDLPAVANNNDIQQYIRKINDYLTEQSIPLSVLSINSITTKEARPLGRLVNSTLLTNEQSVEILISAEPLYFSFTFSFAALAAAMAFILLSKTNIARAPQLPSNKPIQTILANDDVALYINLKQKTLYSTPKSKPVVLQNKPFCFYVALLRYCINHPSAHLSHQQPLPEELSKTANETFAHLIELGHTKRKRPDFTANLDKTLSEIRASLDEVFAEMPKEKRRYYPPRAQGEGSRSKQHSYALLALEKSDVIFIEN